MVEQGVCVERWASVEGRFVARACACDVSLHSRLRGHRLGVASFLVCRWCVSVNMDLIKRFKVLSARLLQRPSDSTELVACEGLFDSVAENDLPALEQEAVATTQLVNFLLKYQFNVADETLHTVHSTFVWIGKMDDVMQSCSELLSKYVAKRRAGERVWRKAPWVPSVIVCCVVCVVSFPPCASTVAALRVGPLHAAADVCVVSVRSKLELNLRRSRDRVHGDMRNFAAEIEEFTNKADVSQLNANCEQLNRLKSILDATDRCEPRSPCFSPGRCHQRPGCLLSIRCVSCMGCMPPFPQMVVCTCMLLLIVAALLLASMQRKTCWGGPPPTSTLWWRADDRWHLSSHCGTLLRSWK